MVESKGQATKNHILQQGLLLASTKGLVNISIGGLAERAKMSRSGLFAHFLSKEQLQLEILEYANQVFQETVIDPCLRIGSPSQRLVKLVELLPNWYERSNPKIPGGCLFIEACLEFDDRPGKIRDSLMEKQRAFLNYLKSWNREAIQKKEFTGALDDEKFAFVFYSFYMGYHHYKKFFGDQNARAHVDVNLLGLIDYAQRTPVAAPLAN